MKISSHVISSAVVLFAMAVTACRGRSSGESTADDGSAGGGNDTGGMGGSASPTAGTSGTSQGAAGSGAGATGSAGTSGGRGGSGGASNGCTCTDFGDFDCTRSVEEFCVGPGSLECPMTLDDTLANLEAICEYDGHVGRYGECAGGYVEVSWIEGAENEYRLIFDASTGALVGGEAIGYVSGTTQCREDYGSVRAGVLPACGESCRFCSDIDEGIGGEGGGPGLPHCDGADLPHGAR